MTLAALMNSVMLAAGVLCGVLCVVWIRREPRRLSCAVLLVAALYLAVPNGLELLLPSREMPNGDLQVGLGDELLLTIDALFMLVSFFGGIALCVNGLQLLRREGASLAHLLPLIFGCLAILWPFMLIAPLMLDTQYDDLMIFIYRNLWPILLYVPGMLVAVLLYSFIYAALPKPVNPRFILVLGAGLRDGKTVTPLLAARLDRAIRLWKQGGKQAHFVVSGGKGSDERVSEAAAMQRYLLDQGVPGRLILLEDRSTTTAENIRFSKALLERYAAESEALEQVAPKPTAKVLEWAEVVERAAPKHAEAVERAAGSSDCKLPARATEALKHAAPAYQEPSASVMLVTSNFHVLRAVILARNLGLDAQGVGAKTAFYFLPAAFIREYIAVIFAYKYLALIYVAITVALQVLDVLIGN